MELLERDEPLARLGSALDEASAGTGGVVLVAGEAGVGKTSLVRAFAAARRDGIRVLHGACDDLGVPRALGPFLDMDRQLGGTLAPVLAASERHEAFDALLEELGSRSPTLVLLEDVHWADEATLDAIVFLGRRVAGAPILLVLTFRSDELPPAHPLRAALGSLPAPDVRRIDLSPLSPEAVAHLAGSDGDAARLHALTGGNPFFVSEVVAAGDASVPATVQDVVLAKVARLSPEARACAELVSVVPARCELWLLDAVLPEAEAAVSEGVDGGVLTLGDEGVGFRHELARRAVEEALSPLVRQRLNRLVLDALRTREVDPARLAHHAFEAKDEAAFLELALPAARHSSRSGAHREALALLERALPLFERLPPAERAKALEELRYEAFLGARIPAALEAQERALALWRELGDERRTGEALRWLSFLSWASAKPDVAEALADEAIAVLAALPPGPELAAAYSNRSRLYLFAHRNDAAVEWGLKAVALARKTEDWETVAETQVNVGSALVPQDAHEGIAVLSEAAATAQERGLHVIAARALMNLSWGHQVAGDLHRAVAVLHDGIQYSVVRDQEALATHGRAHMADLELRLGRWDEAEATSRDAIERSGELSVARADAVLVLGRVQARRGDEEARRWLDESWRLAEEFGELPLLGPAACGLAELHWLAGDDDAALEAVEPVFALALQVGSPWDIGELAFWRWRAGDPAEPPDRCAEPYRLQLAGDWAGAAAAWAALDQPYERALALLDAPEETALLEGLEVALALGAEPLAARLRAALRRLGVRSIPRGPRVATRRNPAGLSARQMEVLALVAEGLTNAEIARRLVLSAKTVDHHVSAILGKLRVGSRREAAAAAEELGLVVKDGGTARQT